jgi:hypothetical protein
MDKMTLEEAQACNVNCKELLAELFQVCQDYSAMSAESANAFMRAAIEIKTALAFGTLSYPDDKRNAETARRVARFLGVE